MIPGIILTSILPSELLMKRKDKFIEKFMASQSFGLLCHSVTDIYCHNRFVCLSF